MMDKQSNKSVPCTYCEKPALPNTDPPVCEEHAHIKQEQEKKASEGPSTLKELN